MKKIVVWCLVFCVLLLTAGAALANDPLMVKICSDIEIGPTGAALCIGEKSSLSFGAGTSYEGSTDPNQGLLLLHTDTGSSDVPVYIDGMYTISLTGSGFYALPPSSSIKYEFSITVDPYGAGNNAEIRIYTKDTASDEKVAVVIYPEDEFGAYYLTADSKREYIWFHTYDICKRFMPNPDACSDYLP